MNRLALSVTPLALSVGLILAGCAGTLAPRYERPDMPVAGDWPTQPTFTQAREDELTWEKLFADSELRRMVELALSNNRDLRVATLNIERARAQYRIQRSQLLPAVDVAVAGNSGRTPGSVSATGAPVVAHTYGADVAISAWELDLFGRLRSLSNQAFQSYLATQAAQQGVALSLVAEVANTYLTLAADCELLQLARDEFQRRQEAYDMQLQMRDIGEASDLALRQAEAEMEAARDQALALESAVGMDRNALELLVGTPLPVDVQPQSTLESMLSQQEVPAGLPSDLLRRRPDIVAAEHVLRGANANIGAARAAFFPSLRLTGSAGRASDSLSSLFDGGNQTWSFVPQITVPIFSGGRLRANLEVAKVDKDIAIADYEHTIQSAFRDVADTLAVRSTLDARLTSQQRQVQAAQIAYDLVHVRYETGVSSYLEVLDAQRTLYAAQQSWISIRLARQSNLILLFKAVGGDFDAPTAVAAIE